MTATGVGAWITGAPVSVVPAVGVRVCMSMFDRCMTLDQLLSRLSVLGAMYQSSHKSGLDMYMSYNCRNFLPEGPGALIPLLERS